MDFAIAKVSTKGQIVIPRALRKNVRKGDEFLIVKDEERLILKKLGALAEDLRSDLAFAEKVEDAWTTYREGKFKSASRRDFLKELEAC